MMKPIVIQAARRADITPTSMILFAAIAGPLGLAFVSIGLMVAAAGSSDDTIAMSVAKSGPVVIEKRWGQIDLKGESHYAYRTNWQANIKTDVPCTVTVYFQWYDMFGRKLLDDCQSNVKLKPGRTWVGAPKYVSDYVWKRTDHVKVVLYRR